MQNKKLSIRKIVSYLSDEEAEGGGFWLPNIQRPFVWSEEQIARLFDSIMREYPISTLLVWKTKEEVKHRKFIDNYRRDIELTDFFVPDNRKAKLMVLDGQQRLQSLFIGLKGSYEGRELYLDILSGANTSPEDIRFHFAFRPKDSAQWPWVRFKDIISVTNKLDPQIAQAIARLSPEPLAQSDLEKLLLVRRQAFFPFGTSNCRPSPNYQTSTRRSSGYTNSATRSPLGHYGATLTSARCSIGSATPALR